MSDKKDGGPAFPENYIYDIHDGKWRPPSAKYEYAGGMSLRDYFAAKALVGTLSCEGLFRAANEASVQEPKPDEFLCMMMALMSYRLADAMLAAMEAR